MSSPSRSAFRWMGLVELLACGAGFGATLWIYILLDPVYALLFPERWGIDLVLSASAAWVGVSVLGGGWTGGARNLFDLSFCAVGFTLVVQYGLNYLSLVHPTPWPVVMAGGITSVILISGLQRLADGWVRRDKSVLLAGYDETTASLTGALRGRIAGVVTDDPTLIPSGIPILGGFQQFDEAVTATRPALIIVTQTKGVEQIAPRRLLELQYSGVSVQDSRVVFEDLLQRICWQRLRPVDLLFSSPVLGNRAVKTLQAIYTNLAGLALLLVALPLMVVLGILAAIANGGRAFESVPCAGLQQIPFHLLRFHTRRRNGAISWMGKLLDGLHLTNLPQLVNVVRGEMGLFGPPPVRREFADRLCALLPAYPHRFAVKPGVLGWSQAMGGGAAQVPDDAVRLGYDLYYAKQQSPSFDIDILLRTVSGGSSRAEVGTSSSV